MKHSRENYEQLQLSARRMRANSTQAEYALWQALRGRKSAGLKFYCQKVIGPFIADFYCASARLVIEVDGDIHDNQKDVDMVRTWRFENYGYRVIRFSNEMVLNRLEIVLAEIIQTALTSNPSPNSGRWEKKVLAQTHSPDTGRQDTAPLPLESGEGAGDEVA